MWFRIQRRSQEKSEKEFCRWLKAIINWHHKATTYLSSRTLGKFKFEVHVRWILFCLRAFIHILNWFRSRDCYEIEKTMPLKAQESEMTSIETFDYDWHLSWFVPGEDRQEGAIDVNAISIHIDPPLRRKTRAILSGNPFFFKSSLFSSSPFFLYLALSKECYFQFRVDFFFQSNSTTTAEGTEGEERRSLHRNSDWPIFVRYANLSSHQRA